MATTLAWDDEAASIIRCDFRGKFTVDDYAVMEGDFPMMVRGASHRVDMIAILHSGASLPRNILKELHILLRVLPPHFGMAVGVGSGFLLTNPVSVGTASLFLNIFDREMNDKLRVARSVEGARHLIGKNRMKNQQP